MPNEQEMLAALRRRDPAAFSQLFETYSDKVYRLAVGLLENEIEAEEVVQDAFMRLFERLDQFEGRSKLGTWLYRVTYNLCQDRLRKRRPVSHLAMDVDDDETIPVPTIFVDWSQVPERYLTEAEITAELDRAIATLPPKLKAVFMLREIEGLSTKECAEVLEISESAAKVRLHRARLLLREQLAAYFTELAVQED
jgi:RNA polymerase sigma-70 factor (ECF subfamily)